MRARRTLNNSRRRSLLDEESPTPAVLASTPRPAPAVPRRAVSKLPLVVALVPDPDVWRVAGVGRTLVARRRSDGRIAWASVAFDLKHPHAIDVFGNLEADEGNFEEILDALYRIEDAPPVVGGSAALAARFAYGSIAAARTREHELPDQATALLGVFERPKGSQELHLEALLGPEGLCTPDLIARCKDEAEAALPLGQSLAVHVALDIRCHRTAELRRALERDHDFVKESPEHHVWKPGCAGGGTLGSVTFLGGDDVEAETVALSLGGLLCARLKRLAEGGLELRRVEHTTPKRP